MKNKLLCAVMLLFSALCGNAQSPLFYAYGNIQSVASVGGGNYNVTINNYNGGYKMYPDANYEAADIPASPTNFVLWGSCVRFEVQSRVSTTPFVIRVADINGALASGDLQNSRICILQEGRVGGYNLGAVPNVADGNAGSLAGINPFEGACIQNYYRDQLQQVIVFGVTTDATLAGDGQATPLKIAQQGATNGQVMTWTGSTWAPATPAASDGSETKVNAGTGISVTGTGTTGSPYVVSNTSPDQTVAISGAGISAVTGTYPNFTVTTTEAQTATTVSAVPASPLTGTTVQTQLDELAALTHAPATVTDNARIDFTLTGQNITADLAQNGATNGQVMTWTGSAWAPASASGTLRYSAGNGAFVTASATGVTFTRTTASQWTFNIPAGVELFSFDINNNGAQSATAALDVDFVFAGTRAYNQDATSAMSDALIPLITTLEKLSPGTYPTTAASNSPAWTASITTAGTLRVSTVEFTEVGNGGANGTSIKGVF